MEMDTLARAARLSLSTSSSATIKLETEALLSRPPVLDWDRLINCGICYSHLSLERATRLPCGHRFHPSCISEWADTASTATCPLCRDVLVYEGCGHRLLTFFTVNVKFRYNEFDGMCRPCAPTAQAQEQLRPLADACAAESDDGQAHHQQQRHWEDHEPDILRCRAAVVQAIQEDGVDDLLESLWCRLHDPELRQVLIGPVAEDLMRVAKVLEILKFYEARPDLQQLVTAQLEVRSLIDNWSRYLLAAARGVCGLLMLNAARKSW